MPTKVELEAKIEEVRRKISECELVSTPLNQELEALRTEYEMMDVVGYLGKCFKIRRSLSRRADNVEDEEKYYYLVTDKRSTAGYVEVQLLKVTKYRNGEFHINTQWTNDFPWDNSSWEEGTKEEFDTFFKQGMEGLKAHGRIA